MKPPHNAILFEGELATFWFDKNGILYANAKPVERTFEKQKKNYEFVRQITDNKKVCLLSDVSISRPQDRQTRNYSENEIPKVFKAMAVISKSPLGKMITSSFLSVKSPPIPIKFFTSQKEAREWLKQYL